MAKPLSNNLEQVAIDVAGEIEDRANSCLCADCWPGESAQEDLRDWIKRLRFAVEHRPEYTRDVKLLVRVGGDHLEAPQRTPEKK